MKTKRIKPQLEILALEAALVETRMVLAEATERLLSIQRSAKSLNREEVVDEVEGVLSYLRSVDMVSTTLPIPHIDGEDTVDMVKRVAGYYVGSKVEAEFMGDK